MLVERLKRMIERHHADSTRRPLVPSRPDRLRVRVRRPRTSVASFEAGLAAAQSAVAEISAAGRSHDFALGLAAAGEAIHALTESEDAWQRAIDGEPTLRSALQGGADL